MFFYILHILAFFLALIILLFVLESINRIKYHFYKSRVLKTPIINLPTFENFQIMDPYALPGDYHKAQLHLHTSNSFDVREKKPVAECISRYMQAGYHFIVITDHDKTTNYPFLNNERFLALPGQEVTIPVLPYLGRHLLKIDHPGEPILIPAHPNWGGNFGTGRWYLKYLLKLDNFFLIEIFNRHSDSSADLRLWHILLQNRGYRRPVWGIAVDDSDNASPIDQGWIMIKTPTVSLESFVSALKHGAFYASTGAEASFAVERKKIKVWTPTPATITFIDGQNQPVKTLCGTAGEYEPNGRESFIRVEVANGTGKAWSQPFFLVAN